MKLRFNYKSKVTSSLRAGSRWSASTIKCASRNRWDKKVSMLWSLQIFHFQPRNRRKNKPTNLHRKCELWQLRFPGKIVNLIHNNMQAWYTLLIKKNRQSLCLARTHLIPSDLAFSQSFRSHDETRSCCFVACFQSQQGHIRLQYLTLLIDPFHKWLPI